MERKKTTEVPTTDSNILKPNKLHTYNEIASLTATKLKDLCVNYKIDVSLPKKAKIVVLCHTLGISATGINNTFDSSRRSHSFKQLTSKQNDELERLTPRVIYSLPASEWSTNITCIPEIDDTTVKKYLLQCNVLTKASSRTYKLSRPYQLKQFVHSLRYCDLPTSDTFCVVSARCNPSQATSPDEVKALYVIVDKITGEPYHSFCTCTVGFSETCGHIGASLFRLSDLVARGVKEVSSLPACTETLCGWTDPKGSKSEPATFDQLKIRKKTPTVRRTLDSYGKKVSAPKPPTYDAVAELHANLISATHHLGQYCPAVHVLNASRFKDTPPQDPPKPPILEDHMNGDTEMLAYSKEVEVETTPLSIIRLSHKTFKSDGDPGFEQECESFVMKAATHTASSSEVDSVTEGQSNNPEWFEQRKGCITATSFSAVIKAVEKSKENPSVVRSIVGKTKKDYLSKVPAIKWGRKNEEKARQFYLQKFSKFHTNMTIKQHGLVVSEHCNYVRGSPDGIVRCNCHSDMPRLLEIKCPFTARYMTISKAVDEKKIKYLTKSDGSYRLKSGTPDGYYEQVQGLLGITGIKDANLVVWTTIDMAVVHVKFDAEFFNGRLMPACQAFYKKYVVPAIVLGGDIIECHSDSDEELSVIPAESVMDIEPQPAGASSTVEASLAVDPSPGPSSKYSARDTSTSNCRQCKKLLPEDGILPDNSNASVGCDCPNCGGCNVWFCWPCAKFNEEWVDENIDWFCPNCTRECDLVY